MSEADHTRQARIRNAALVAIYVFDNLVVVAKYAERGGVAWWLAAGGWLAALATAALAWRVLLGRWGAGRPGPRVYAGFALAAAVALVFLMSRFDPEAIRVTRYPALNDWIARLLRGEFPYASAVQPSAFPVLFLCALPFYVLGDVGGLQIAAWFLFAWLCRRAARDDPRRALTALALLLGAPLFLYEVAVRSELFSNMTLVLVVLVATERWDRRGSGILYAVAAGLALSTRGIVTLVHAVYYGALFRRRLGAGVRFAAVAGATFLVTLAPFALWDPERFLRYGPLTIQMSYIPKPLLAVALVAAAWLGVRARGWRDVYFALPVVLFAVVGCLFAIAVVREGWREVLLGDRFDISYFAFAHTFAIYSLARCGRKKVGLERAASGDFAREEPPSLTA